MHDCAVSITTILRPSLERAVRSVYAQDFAGTIQILVGIDKVEGDRMLLDRLRADCPPNRTLTVVDLGYSTAYLNGGLYSNLCGGMLPTILSFAADSRYVAYLDDDDWYAPEHVRTLLAAIQGRDWAFSLSWYVNPANDEPMCIDRLESVGPGRGAHNARFGGFVRPSCLIVDKLRCMEVLHCWADALAPEGYGSDRRIFAGLRERHPQWGESELASVYYTIRASDVNHAIRTAYARTQGYDITRLPPA